MLSFTSTERTDKVLNYNGFQYTLKRERKTAVEWRCRLRNCKSTLSLSRDNTVIAREPNEHIPSCLSYGSKLIMDQALENMKKEHEKKQLQFPKYMLKKSYWLEWQIQAHKPVYIFLH